MLEMSIEQGKLRKIKKTNLSIFFVIYLFIIIKYQSIINIINIMNI
jgi:hypothetical protein